MSDAGSGKWKAFEPRLWRWSKGRGESGYSIFPLFRFAPPFPIPCDSYLIFYPKGSSIGWHRDPNPLGRHYRVNIEWSRGIGGTFVSEETIWDCGPIHFFRPDISSHKVTEVLRGFRLVFSLGWILP